ncbi:MAG: hypothetical protein LBP55_05215 [Candidatus Adiutrix sp.]|nr:hypothetical protein [Candidatus Adiutrix sp.]
MIYRTAHRATYRNINNNLGAVSYRIAQLTGQIASERRINTPSDDPAGAAKVLDTRSAMANIKQYVSNNSVSDLWLAESGSAVQSMKITLDEIYAKLDMQGSTDTYNDSQRQIIADEVKLLFAELIQEADTKVGGTNSYLFGGQRVTTQPFSLKVEAQKVIMGCDNSDKWTGKVVNYGDMIFNNRPDLPIHSQDFLIEVVQPGGVDSRYYANTSSIYTAQIKGSGLDVAAAPDIITNPYSFKISAASTAYNDVEIKFVAGPANQTATGNVDANSVITFPDTMNGGDPITISYVLGTSSAATVAAWDAASGTLTVTMQTDGKSPPNSVATADTVRQAIFDETGVTPGGTGTGIVQPQTISFNNPLDVKVDGHQITVYLHRKNSPDGFGELDSTAIDVANHLNATGLVTASVPVGPNVIVQPTSTAVGLEPGQPYTLAQVTADPKGTQNDLIWSIKNGSPYIGEAGNSFSLAYVVKENFFQDNPDPANPGKPLVVYDPATQAITVQLAGDQGVYDNVFGQVYNDPASGAYLDAEKANEMALTAAIKTTANDIIAAVQAHPDLKDIVDVNLADGNSGDGKVNVFPGTNTALTNGGRAAFFSEGYDQPAMFRVSQDGGQTWGPPMSFAASEYKSGDMFYNATLGHASFTTSFPGQANDLVFTARQMGTWGNDLRVEYRYPDSLPASSDASVTVGPNPWNICVTLGVDASGKVVSTANDIMKAVNDHPVASQLVTADLANYHEGGGGVVKPMECASLSVGEPYQVDGKSVITPLGHATATVSFNYSAPAQSDPNIAYQALQAGPEGNDIGIRYTTSADPTFYSSAGVASGEYQDFTSVRYEYLDAGGNIVDSETEGGKTVMVVHLATESLPTCPSSANSEASAKWNELYPLYSRTSDRAVITNAGAVVQAVIDLNTREPEKAVVWPSLERWPQGWDTTAKVGPTEGTIWLTGGNNEESAANHGVNLRFIPDGTSLQVGDIFEVPVGWYRGDEENIEINANSNYRTTINTTGSSILGGNGQEGNVLDTVQRLIWGLEHNETELVEKELPKLREAIDKVLSIETKIGTRQIRNEFITQNLETSYYNAQDLLSKVEDADFAQLITDLKNAQTVYEAVLGATGLTRNVSLLNYI